MPDISMCAHEECPSKKTCYRWMAIPAINQSFVQFPLKEGEEKCEWFMELRKSRKKKK